MYYVLYFNIMLLYAVNNSSNNSHGDFWMPFTVTSTLTSGIMYFSNASAFTSFVSVGLFLLKRLQD